jgi:molybdopterin-guanine dinucleotide biosynthesis protein A
VAERVDAAGVVLAGGRSSRMGTPKACLAWHGSTLLYRTAALMGRTVTGPVVVVVGADDGDAWELPDLPPGVVVARDPAPGLGPLQGIAAGLAAVRTGGAAGVGAGTAGRAGAAGPAGAFAAAFVCATDMPFLHPAFVRAVLAALSDDVALPVARGHRQPLAAAYRVGLEASVVALLAEGGRTPGELFARSRVTVLDDAALRADPAVARLDPELESLTNVNTPAEYAAARARPPAPVVVEHAGARHTVRAATLAEALAGVGGRRCSSVLLNGVPVAPDPGLPLVTGDALVLR